MDKEFEALKKIGNLHSIAKGCAICFTDEYKIIKQALLELQAIKEAKPSEALEKELDDKLIFNGNHLMSGFDYKGKQIIAMPLNEYSKLMKLEKTWEVVKEKPQAELSLIQLGKIKTYEEYLDYTDKWDLDEWGDLVYTQEEFDLLKEMLG